MTSAVENQWADFFKLSQITLFHFANRRPSRLLIIWLFFYRNRHDSEVFLFSRETKLPVWTLSVFWWGSGGLHLLDTCHMEQHVQSDNVICHFMINGTKSNTDADSRNKRWWHYIFVSLLHVLLCSTRGKKCVTNVLFFLPKLHFLSYICNKLAK